MMIGTPMVIFVVLTDFLTVFDDFDSTQSPPNTQSPRPRLPNTQSLSER